MTAPNPGLYFYYYDGLGSVCALSNSNTSQIVERYVYSAFGQTRILSPNLEPRTASAYGNTVMFTGRRLESPGALSRPLYDYRARIYTPDLGRFLQTDPIGYADTMNLYQYCGNNPINFIDPFGNEIFLIIGQDIAYPGIGDIVLDFLRPVLDWVEAVDVPIPAAIPIPQIPAPPIMVPIDQPSDKDACPPKERSKYRIGRRKDYDSKKDAYEDAKRAGKGREPIHHPQGEHGPHYHPDVKMPKEQTPKMPNPHDHYYYPKSYQQPMPWNRLTREQKQNMA